MLVKEDLDPIVWRQKRHKGIKSEPKIQENTSGTVSIYDLDMDALLMGWIMIERPGVPLKHKHIAMYSYNMLIVAWTKKWWQKYQNQWDDYSKHWKYVREHTEYHR